MIIPHFKNLDCYCCYCITTTTTTKLIIIIIIIINSIMMKPEKVKNVSLNNKFFFFFFFFFLKKSVSKLELKQRQNSSWREKKNYVNKIITDDFHPKHKHYPHLSTPPCWHRGQIGSGSIWGPHPFYQPSRPSGVALTFIHEITLFRNPVSYTVCLVWHA